METPNKAPRMRVHLLRLWRMMVVVVLSWERTIVRVGTMRVRSVLLCCEVGSIVVGLVCGRLRCGVCFCVFLVLGV